jgi:hypothetical protein
VGARSNKKSKFQGDRLRKRNEGGIETAEVREGWRGREREVIRPRQRLRRREEVRLPDELGHVEGRRV